MYKLPPQKFGLFNDLMYLWVSMFMWSNSTPMFPLTFPRLSWQSQYRIWWSVSISELTQRIPDPQEVLLVSSDVQNTKMYLNAAEYCSVMFSYNTMSFGLGTPFNREILKSKKIWFENPDHQKMIILLFK